MENEGASARDALEVVEQTRHVNAERLRRPNRYWVMLGGMMTAFTLMPYTEQLPATWQYTAPAAWVLVIGAVAAWKQPTAVRKIRLSGRMGLQLAGFALLAAVISAASRGAYIELGWWWLPAVSALVLFAAIVACGSAMDRSWARQASGIGR